MKLTKPMREQAQNVANHLKLLSNPNRLMIACRLLEGEMSVGEIESELGITQPGLSRELGRLRDEGIITARRQSKVVFYSFADARMERLIISICNAMLTDQDITPAPPASPARPARRNTTPFDPRPKFKYAHVDAHHESDTKPASTQNRNRSS